MKKNNLFKAVALVVLSGAIAACGGKKAEVKAEDNLTDYMGMFVGTLPAADCPGILTHVTLGDDSLAAVTRLYLDSDETSETDYGKWSYQDSVFTVTTTSNDSVPVEETSFYRIMPDNSIVMVGDKTQAVNPLYTLKKEAALTSDSFVGSYNQGGEEKGAYVQTLTIAKNEDGTLSVNVAQTGGKGKGCEFTGKGHLVNNQIEVNLKEVNPDLKGVMVIRPLNEGNGMNVFTSKFDDRYDLMFFCGGGGSLAGDYIKAEAPAEENK